MDIITCHLNADFDAFSSMVAAGKLYPGAWLVFPGAQEKRVRDFIADFPFAQTGIRKIREVEPGKVSRLIVVDAGTPGRLGPLAELLSRPGVEVHVYDHHPHGEGGIRGAIEVIEPIGATITILIEMLREKKIKPTPLEASLMGLGLYEETGGFLFPSTTERDILAMAQLFKNGASARIISRYMKTEFFGRKEVSLLGKLLENSRDIVVRGIRVRIAKATAGDYVLDAAQLAHSIMDAEEIDALLMMVSMKGKIILVGRSRAPEVDVAGVLAEFGGGGHRYAASATITDLPLEILEEKLEDAIKRHVRPELTAGDVMTRPVVTIDWSDTIAQAQKSMTIYGVNVLPVVRDGHYTGIISREVVEKAIFHGFQKQRVTDFTMTEASTVAAEAPIDEVESLMIERNQRFMPVLNAGGDIEGAITRTDILRVLYEDYLRRRTRTEPESKREREKEKGKEHFERNLVKSIKEKFPAEVVEFLKLAGRTAQEMGLQAYMVGGSVRDLLRGEQNLDIDLVIEGNAIEFARSLAGRLGARMKSHERFGTAVLITDNLKIDLATARTEYYEKPAALPTVEISSIKRDLHRRDFTINALAVKINPADFGQLADYFGGRRDLREKTIRVLHDLSFIEDPTRAFRAVRFGVRFGFKLSVHTEELLKSTLEMGLFERLSGSRLYEELLLIFKETEPVLSIKKLQEYGLLKVLHPAMKDEDVVRTFQAVHDALLWFDLSFTDEAPDRPALYLMALLSGLEENEIMEALLRLQASTRVASTVSEGILKAKELLASRLAQEKTLEDPVTIYDSMHNMPLESLLLAMSLAPDEGQKRAVTHYLLELRKIRPALNGEDLLKMGLAQGPLFSKIFTGILHEKLKGKLKTREEEALFVKAHFKPSTSCIS